MKETPYKKIAEAIAPSIKNFMADSVAISEDLFEATKPYIDKVKVSSPKYRVNKLFEEARMLTPSMANSSNKTSSLFVFSLLVFVPIKINSEIK